MLQDTDEMADFLNKCGIKTGAYHSDRSDKDKLSLYEKWSSGEIQVICATIGKYPNCGLTNKLIRRYSFRFGDRQGSRSLCDTPKCKLICLRGPGTKC